jgi:hypothetical protein
VELRSYLCRVAAGSGAYSDVRSPLYVDCRLALPHVALEVIALRRILSRPGLGLAEIPRIDGFQHLHWGLARESALDRVAILAGRSLVPGILLASTGVTLRLRTGWLKPSICGGVLALAVPAVFFVLRARRRLDVQGWAFLRIMAGLAEELVFRGVYQSLLNRAFGKPWRLADAEFGWGLIITAILFAGSNGLVAVDPQLHARIVLHAAIAPFTWFRDGYASARKVCGHVCLVTI